MKCKNNTTGTDEKKDGFQRKYKDTQKEIEGLKKENKHLKKEKDLEGSWSSRGLGECFRVGEDAWDTYP